MYLADHYKVGGPICPPNLTEGLGTPVPVCPAVDGCMKGKFQPIKWVICCTAAHLLETSNCLWALQLPVSVFLSQKGETLNHHPDHISHFIFIYSSSLISSLKLSFNSQRQYVGLWLWPALFCPSPCKLCGTELWTGRERDETALRFSLCLRRVCVCLEAHTLFSRSSSLHSDWNCLVAVLESSKEASLALGLCEI